MVWMDAVCFIGPCSAGREEDLAPKAESKMGWGRFQEYARDLRESLAAMRTSWLQSTWSGVLSHPFAPQGRRHPLGL